MCASSLPNLLNTSGTGQARSTEAVSRRGLYVIFGYLAVRRTGVLARLAIPLRQPRAETVSYLGHYLVASIRPSRKPMASDIRISYQTLVASQSQLTASC